jgi:hypothetical protein
LFNKLLKIINTFFRHRNIHKFTWEARGTKSVTVYIIINKKLKTVITYTRLFTGSELDTDHYLLQSTFKISNRYYIQRTNKKQNTIKH